MRKIILTGLLLLMCLPVQAFMDFKLPDRRPSAEKWCFDYANVLSDETEEKINDEGRAIQRSFDVDLIVAILPDLGGRDVNEYAVDMFSKWQIGKSTQGKKGLLILIAQEEQKVRIEVGYDLEGFYTDAYVGQVERDILKEFLEQAEWGVGFLATIESFLFRIINNDQQEDVRDIAAPDDDHLSYYSQGAGATNVFEFGAALNAPLPGNYDEVRQYFSAQPTPELAFQRYMELCAKGVKHNNDLTLFTDLSNRFWKNWKHTSGQQKAEAQEVSGKPYYIKIKDDHAVVFFPAKDMKKSPMYFLFKADEGWQVDIATMTRCMRVVGPGWMMLTDIFHAYSEIIIEEYNLVQGFLAPWGDTTGGNHIYLMGGVANDANIPGISIGIWSGYKENSNLKPEDSVIAVNGQPIHDREFDRLRSFFEGAQAGTQFEIELIRDGKRITVTEMIPSAEDGFRFFRPCLKTPRQWLGVYMVQSLDSEWNVTRRLRDQGRFENSSLCEIIDIYPGSPADRAGLKVRDLIVDYGADDNNGEVMPLDVIEHLARTKPGERIIFTVVRDLKDVLKIEVIPEETMHKGYF